MIWMSIFSVAGPPDRAARTKPADIAGPSVRGRLPGQTKMYMGLSQARIRQQAPSGGYTSVVNRPTVGVIGTKY